MRESLMSVRSSNSSSPVESGKPTSEKKSELKAVKKKDKPKQTKQANKTVCTYVYCTNTYLCKVSSKVE